MGHALRKAVGVIAVPQGRGQAAGTPVVAAQAGVPRLAASSLKAALDRDWDDPAAREEALALVLGFLGQVEALAAGQTLAELHIDRAYLASDLVGDRGPDLVIYCKAWRVRNTGGRFAKGQFTLDFAAGPRRRRTGSQAGSATAGSPRWAWSDCRR